LSSRGHRGGSFYRWRKVLELSCRSDTAEPMAALPTQRSHPGFVDIGSVGMGGSRVEVHLELGEGIRLHLVRLMFFPEGQIRVHLHGAPTDMRKSFDGLCALVRTEMQRDPFNGDLYGFINRRGTQLKVCISIAAAGACGASALKLGGSSVIGVRCAHARWTTRG
jgi:hypothetical protein